jgi:hypothetical protein
MIMKFVSMSNYTFDLQYMTTQVKYLTRVIAVRFFYLAFQSFDYDRTWWKLFQKRVVRTKLDIYVFITIPG